MAVLVWDATGSREFETGVDRGVLYPTITTGNTTTYGTGVAWNGLTGVTESPEGADTNDLWADNIKYASLVSAEKAGGSIEAYMYPDEFMECDGSKEIATGIYIGQQQRKTFGFCYRTIVGNDINPEAGYKIHLFYGCLASPSQKDYATVNDSPDAITFSWDFEANPVPVEGNKPSATLVIDSTKIDADKLKLVEDKLYGTATEEPKLLLPNEVMSLIQ